MFAALKGRRSKMEVDLRRLGNLGYFRLRFEPQTSLNDLPQVILRGDVKIRKTDYFLRVWEDFREFDGQMVLYGFRYSVGDEDPSKEPFFRYECHPDVDDPIPEDTSNVIDENINWRNNFTFNPHFHPGNNMTFPINRLHFLFHRSERGQIVFSLIGWLEVDLVKRFYDAGRVASV
jgi:hypothetical protein